jgi:sugar/nucleoside kinase (ribokinase family)
MAAAALSVTKAGSSESVPSLVEVQDFLGTL